MHADWLLALSAATTGISIAGGVAGLRAPQGWRVRTPLSALFALFAMICVTPLVGALLPQVWVFHLPALLPALFALPVAVHRFALGRMGVKPSRSSTRRDAAPLFAAALVTLGFWMLPGPSKAALFIEGRLPGGWAASALALATFVLVLVWIAVSCAYLAATVIALRRHRRALKALYSNTERFELRWIDGFLMALAALWLIAAVSLASDNLGAGFAAPDLAAFIAAGAVLLFLIAVSLAPDPEGGGREASAQATDAQDKYARSALSPDRARRIAARLETAMTRERAYLDPALSLDKLSRLVGAPPNHVSQTLNAHLGTTFFDYVARWRVESAKPQLAAGEASVLEVALDVGFNSRSTFYKAFKRETGMTPRAFRAAGGSGPPQNGAGR